ncbi:DedA family protein [Cohnella yongneupensis]|uniref:DedA family protein n=1 Tax=Cohnella yongneupensis TaxID=425006 RepID=A0ABW0R3B4_9BACL
MHQLIDWISNMAVQLIETFGVFGILVGMILESACIPIPSEVILLCGGAAVANETMSFAEVVIAGVVGNLIGSVIAYFVGLLGGRSLLERYGKYVLFRPSHLKQSQRWFDRYGEGTVFFTRNLPFIRTFISLPAGIAGMNFRKFVLFTALGCIPWTIALTYAGYKLGSDAKAVEQYVRPVSYAIAGLACVLLVYWLLRKKSKKPSVS